MIFYFPNSLSEASNKPEKPFQINDVAKKNSLKNLSKEFYVSIVHKCMYLGAFVKVVFKHAFILKRLEILKIFE